MVAQTGERRLVVDCKLNPTALVGHVKITFAPEGIKVSSGWMKMLNTVPFPEVLLPEAVP